MTGVTPALAAELGPSPRIEDVLARGGTLVCEAGTGTGKSLGYLVPAALSGRRVVVSTATLALLALVWVTRPRRGGVVGIRSAPDNRGRAGRCRAGAQIVNRPSRMAA